jgi:hypothetical protein
LGRQCLVGLPEARSNGDQRLLIYYDAALDGFAATIAGFVSTVPGEPDARVYEEASCSNSYASLGIPYNAFLFRGLSGP